MEKEKLRGNSLTQVHLEMAVKMVCICLWKISDVRKVLIVLSLFL